MTDKVNSEDKKAKLLSAAISSSIPFEILENQVSDRKDKGYLISQIVRLRHDLRLWNALGLLTHLNDSELKEDRERVIRSIISKLGTFETEDNIFRQIRDVCFSIRDPENFLLDFLQLKERRGYVTVGETDFDRIEREKMFPGEVFKYLKERDSMIVHKFVCNPENLGKLLKMIDEIPCAHTRGKILGDALSCPAIPLKVVGDILKRRQETFHNQQRRRYTYQVPLESDVIPTLRVIISDRKDLSIEEAFQFLNDLNLYPCEKMVSSLLEKDGGLEKFLEQAEKESDWNQRVLLGYALRAPSISFLEAQRIVRNQEDQKRLIFEAFRNLSYENALECFRLYGHSSDDRKYIAQEILRNCSISSVTKLAAFLDNLEFPDIFLKDLSPYDLNSYTYSGVALVVLFPELVKMDSKYKYLEESISCLIEKLREVHSGPVKYSEILECPASITRKIVSDPQTSFDQIISIYNRYYFNQSTTDTNRNELNQKYRIFDILSSRSNLSFNEALTLLDRIDSKSRNFTEIAVAILRKFEVFPFDQVIALLDRLQTPRLLLSLIDENRDHFQEIPPLSFEMIVALHALLEENEKYKELAPILSNRFRYTISDRRDEALRKLFERSDISKELATSIAKKITDPEMREQLLVEALKR